MNGVVHTLCQSRTTERTGDDQFTVRNSWYAGSAERESRLHSRFLAFYVRSCGRLVMRMSKVDVIDCADSALFVVNDKHNLFAVSKVL